MVRVIDDNETPYLCVQCGECGRWLEFGYADIEMALLSEDTFFIRCPHCGSEVSVYDNVM